MFILLYMILSYIKGEHQERDLSYSLLRYSIHLLSSHIAFNKTKWWHTFSVSHFVPLLGCFN